MFYLVEVFCACVICFEFVVFALLRAAENLLWRQPVNCCLLHIYVHYEHFFFLFLLSSSIHIVVWLGVFAVVIGHIYIYIQLVHFDRDCENVQRTIINVFIEQLRRGRTIVRV